MKKLKVLAILLAMVLCFSVAALIGCNNGDKPEPKPTPSGGETTDVPVVDGKVTFYFTLAEGSVEIPEYGAVFYAGGLTGWDEPGAPAFTKLEGKNVYYLQLVLDKTKDQWDEYQLTLGYSAASGLPADKQGIQWPFKSDSCAEVAYPDNPKFEWADGAKTVNLGTQKFSTALSAPETVAKVELRVTFSEPLDASNEVYLMGGFNGWDSTKAKATANTERTTYSLELKDILCTDYEYKILVMATGENVVTKNENGEDLGVWDQYFADSSSMNVPADSKVMARIEVSAGGSNLSVRIIKRDNNSYVDLADTVSVAVPSDNIAVKGLNINNAEMVEGKNDDGTGNGVYTRILSLAGTKTLKVEFKEALPADVIVFCPGSLIDWSSNGTQMTISADRKSATLVAEILPKDYEFKLVFFHKDADTSDVWKGTEYNNDGGNWKVTVEGYDDGDVNLFEDAIVAPTVEAPSTEVPTPVEADVVLTVKFDADMTGKIVKIKGSMTGWQDKEMVKGADNVTFTVTVSKDGLNSGEYEFIIGVGDANTTDFYADGHKIAGEGTYGGANSKVTIPAAGGEVKLYGEKVLPSTPSAN
ncbi:MAG: hypothetical protein K2L12_06805 [Clostridia bacterium]|nr:hypothetical protein [Clostridia bacterium]